MNDSDIVNVIKDIEKQYNAYKDGGRSFIQHLANKIQNTVDEDKVLIFDLFLDEIEQNINGLYSIALQTIIELKQIELAPEIERIFIKNRNVKDEKWSYAIIETLLKLNYATPIYYDFITHYLKDNPGKGFFLLVQYCNLDPDKGVPLLSDFYSEFFQGDSQMRRFLESRIGFLVDYFMENKQLDLGKLYKSVIAKNRMAGQSLRSTLLNYFNSSLADKYPKDLVEKACHSL